METSTYTVYTHSNLGQQARIESLVDGVATVERIAGNLFDVIIPVEDVPRIVELLNENFVSVMPYC